MNSRKEYIKNSYSKYWLKARNDIYGFMRYDKNLLEIIKEHSPEHSKLLEVAIGTGYPFADTLCKYDYNVYGIDIAPSLIDECHKTNPKIIAKVCDAESLDYPNETFNTVYCVHSSWYMPDLKKVINDMHRCTKFGGCIIFDILNLNNKSISKLYNKHIYYNSNVFGKLLKTLKNTIKFITRKGVQDWPLIISVTPSFPDEITQWLSELEITNVCVFARKENDKIEIVEDVDSNFSKYDRLIFCIRK